MNPKEQIIKECVAQSKTRFDLWIHFFKLHTGKKTWLRLEFIREILLQRFSKNAI